MAVYMKMIKKFDDDRKVIYQFGPNEIRWGKLSLIRRKKFLIF